MKNRYAFIMIGVALVWGGSFIAVRIAVDDVSPIFLAFLRFAVASPVMLLVAFLKKVSLRVDKKDTPSLFLLALTGVTLLYLLQFIGIQHTTATNAALLINTNVLFISILSAIILKERMPLRKIFGLICGFFGVLLIVTNGSLAIKASFEGDFLVILSALCWAIYSIAGKKLMERYHPISITTYAFLLGTFLLLPFSLKDIGASISLEVWITVAYLAFLCSVFGYLAWYEALAHMDATKVAVFLNLIPLSAMLLAYLILHERITFITIIGASLVLYSIYLTQGALE